MKSFWHNLETWNLGTGQYVSYKSVNLFWLNLPHQNCKMFFTSNVKIFSLLQMDIFCYFDCCHCIHFTNCDLISFLKITDLKKKSCIGSLFCYRRYSILLLRVSPIDCVFCFLPSSYSSRCRMLRTRLLSINMTSVDELSKAEPLDSLLRYTIPLLFTQFIQSSQWQKGTMRKTYPRS